MTSTNYHQGRGDRTAVPHQSDPYREQAKLPEPTSCPDCGLIYHQGRWQEGEPPPSCNMHLCPACRRIKDRAPAAQLSLSGDYFFGHRNVIMKTIHNHAELEKSEHPLERLMNIEEENGAFIISFTGVHIANRIGHALVHGYDGKLSANYADGGGLTRLSWSR